MAYLRRTALLSVLFFLAPALGADAEMKAEWIFDGSKPRQLRYKFGSYGYHPTQTVRPAEGNLRLWLPVREGVGQTGIYSLFALAGDCDVIVTYELLKLDSPKKGYGSGIGLAFDIGEEGTGGRGVIQRLEKPTEGNGYILQTNLPKIDEEYHFKVVSTRKGRIGLRRIKKELIFLASDTPTGELQEMERLPFSDHTIQKVRVYADPGGSPTALDVRLWRIEVRAEEMTGGIPDLQPSEPIRWWIWALLMVAAVGSLALFRRWRNST